MGVKPTQRCLNFTLPVDEDGGSLSAVAGEDESHFWVCLAHICHSLWKRQPAFGSWLRFRTDHPGPLCIKRI